VVLLAEDTFHHKLLVAVDLSDNPKEVELLSVDKAPSLLLLHYYIPKLEEVDRPLQDNSNNKDLAGLSICHNHEDLLNLADQSLVLVRQL
jgi:hypothetical protein